MGSSELPLLLSMGCSGLGPAIATVFTNPLEVCKTRLQFSIEGGRQRVYGGAADCFRKTWQAEGVGGLQAGLGPAVVREGTKTFFRYGLYSPILAEIHDGPTASAPVSTRMAAGAAAGAIAAAVCNPLDLLKCQLQASGGGGVRGYEYRSAAGKCLTDDTRSLALPTQISQVLVLNRCNQVYRSDLPQGRARSVGRHIDLYPAQHDVHIGVFPPQYAWHRYKHILFYAHIALCQLCYISMHRTGQVMMTTQSWLKETALEWHVAPWFATASSSLGAAAATIYAQAPLDIVRARLFSPKGAAELGNANQKGSFAIAAAMMYDSSPWLSAHPFH